MSTFMEFRMAVVPPSSHTTLTPDFELDEDFESLVMDACQLLSQSDCSFRVSGFGQDSWPVDVSYDLSSVIEQLPDALASLRRRESAQIDFYGQGVERVVAFAPDEGMVAIQCTTRTGWVPSPDTESVSQSEAEALLVALARDFKLALEHACPEVAALSPFVDW
ncbi:hypothetical protein ACFRAO_16200 [Streptomyces sp. NPDC056656]|uniref:hypothetical protein n=1 Tax=Streptomyces sp. NPDC056656 TaxID=3345895 RepID=UPI0036C86933